MVKFLSVTFLTIICALVAQVVVVLGLRAAPPAEYWLPEAITMKKMMADAKPSPKIVILGGSSSLFGLDAKRIEAGVHQPVVNLGLHGQLRLDRLFMVARETTRRGDVLLLALEGNYYTCSERTWSGWQVRQGVAWDRRDYFDRKPLNERVAAVLEGGDPTLPLDVAQAWVMGKLHARSISNRLQFMDPEHAGKDLENIKVGLTPNAFAYSASNFDLYGDIQNTTGVHYFGHALERLSQPAGVCPDVLTALGKFKTEMDARGVRVLIVHTPYFVEDGDADDWRAAETQFRRDLASVGISVLDDRQDAFFPPRAFFNTAGHLNAQSREVRTDRLIKALRANQVEAGVAATHGAPA